MAKLGLPETIGLIAREMLQHGESIDNTCNTIRQVYAAMRRAAPRPRRSQLGAVLDMERDGYSRRAISNALGLKTSTIRTYISESRRLAKQEETNA